SIVRRETNSNFGFNLPWWDRLLGTYRPQPAAGHLGMTIGIELFRDPRELALVRMLAQPWRSGAATAAEHDVTAGEHATAGEQQRFPCRPFQFSMPGGTIQRFPTERKPM